MQVYTFYDRSSVRMGFLFLYAFQETFLRVTGSSLEMEINFQQLIFNYETNRSEEGEYELFANSGLWLRTPTCNYGPEPLRMRIFSDSMEYSYVRRTLIKFIYARRFQALFFSSFLWFLIASEVSIYLKRARNEQGSYVRIFNIFNVVRENKSRSFLFVADS